jgi:hypothetical protein
MQKTVINSRVFTKKEVFEIPNTTQVVFANFGTNACTVKVKDTVYYIPETPSGGVNPSSFTIDNFGHYFDLVADINFEEDSTGTKTNKLIISHFNILKP